MLSRSLGAFIARERNDGAWVQSRVDAAMALRRAEPNATEGLTWVDRVAAAAGVSVTVVLDLSAWLSAQTVSDSASVNEWFEIVIGWLEQRPALVPALLRREGLEGLFGTRYRVLQTDEERGRLALPVLRTLSREWMAGSTLVAMELSLDTPPSRLGKCQSAREFVLRVVPELAYVCRLCSQVASALANEGSRQATAYRAVQLQVLAQCFREGFDRPEKLALRIAKGGAQSRVGVHRQFGELSPWLGNDHSKHEEFATLLQRVRSAIKAADRREV